MLDSTSIQNEGLNVYNGKGISFYATRNERNYTIILNHYSHLNRATDPVVLDMPIAELENLENVVPATELLNFKDADSAYKWMLDIFKSETKIFIIDSNKYYKSDPSLDVPDMMKAIEVRVWEFDIPDHILNTL